jgi:hypothetical protein
MHIDGRRVRTVAIHPVLGGVYCVGVSLVFAFEVMPTLATFRRTEPLLCPRWFGWLEVVAALGTAHGALLSIHSTDHSSTFDAFCQGNYQLYQWLNVDT